MQWQRPKAIAKCLLGTKDSMWELFATPLITRLHHSSLTCWMTGAAAMLRMIMPTAAETDVIHYLTTKRSARDHIGKVVITHHTEQRRFRILSVAFRCRPLSQSSSPRSQFTQGSSFNGTDGSEWWGSHREVQNIKSVYWNRFRIRIATGGQTVTKDSPEIPIIRLIVQNLWRYL